MNRPCDIFTMGESNDRLKAARERAGFDSARQAAIRFGWTISTYASHENGQTPVPQKAAEKYAAKFKVSAGWILTGEGSPGYGPEDAEIIELLRHADPEVKAAVSLILQNSKKTAAREEPRPSSRHRPPASRK